MKAKLTFLAVLLSCSAHASFKDGNKLYAQMQGTTVEQLNAVGYITGVADVLDGVSVCAPTNVTAGQLSDMVKKYLESYPQVRNFTADILIQRVLSTAWPCKKGSAL